MNEVGIDREMFGIAFGIAAITSVVFGILPSLHLSRADHLHAMGPRGASSGQGESRMRSALVVGQLVMATVLLVGAGLLIRSFVKLSTVEKGYDPTNVLAFQIVFPPDYSISRKTDAIETVLTRLRATPNVDAAGFTRAGILIPEEIHVGTFVPHGKTVDEMRADPLRPRLRPVSPGYLTAIGVPVLAGREFQAADAASSIPMIVHSIDPEAGIDAILPMDQLVARSIGRPRFYAVILSVFAGVAGVLAGIGIYGVLAYAVVQRTHEIGIRMALGAQRSQVVGLVLRNGMILTTTGLVLGLAGAVAGARLLQGMLFGIDPVDRWTFLAVSLLFGLVATFASYAPARRASMLDPMVALRRE